MEQCCSRITLEHVNPLLNDYEILIKTLTEQLEYYKNEQDALRTEVTTLLNDNKLLSSHVKQLLEKKEHSECNASLNNHKYSEGDFVENLKSQIEFLVKEKESTVELWRNSLATIDQLEEELRLYEGRSHGYVSKTEIRKVISQYEQKIKRLELEQTKSDLALAEVKNSSTSTLYIKEGELRKLSESYESVLATVKVLETKVQKLKSEHERIKGNKTELEKDLIEKTQTISLLRIKANESKMKVNEAVHVVEAALMEKDSALVRESQMKEEIEHMKRTFDEAMEESNKKLKDELDVAKKMYNDKVQKLKTDLKGVTFELKEKKSELEMHKASIKMLEERLDKFSKGTLDLENSSTSKLLILEKNLESTFQKLLFSERRNVQLEAEKQSLRDDLEQMANNYERDIKTRETEKRILENKITALQNELQVSNAGVIEVANKVSEVNSKISLLETDLKKQLVLNDAKHKKILANKVHEIEISNDKINSDLVQKLEAQVIFNQKWKHEVKEISQKLEDRVHKLKEEVKTLKQANKRLTCKLTISEQQLEMYKERLVTLCIDVKKIAILSKDPSSSQILRNIEQHNIQDHIHPEQ